MKIMLSSGRFTNFSAVHHSVAAGKLSGEKKMRQQAPVMSDV